MVNFKDLKIGQHVTCTNPNTYQVMELYPDDEIALLKLVTEKGLKWEYETSIEHILKIVKDVE